MSDTLLQHAATNRTISAGREQIATLHPFQSSILFAIPRPE